MSNKKPLDNHFDNGNSIKLRKEERAKHNKSVKDSSNIKAAAARAMRIARELGLGDEAKDQLRKSKDGLQNKAILRSLVAPIKGSKDQSNSQSNRNNGSGKPNKRNKRKKNDQNNNVKSQTNHDPINNVQNVAQSRPKTSQDVRKYQNDLFNKLSFNKLSTGNNVTEHMMAKMEATLKGVRQYMYNVLTLDNIRLNDEDRTSILSDLAIIDAAIESGKSAEKLKATDLVFKTIRRFMSVDEVPDVEEGLFENLSDLLNWARLEKDPATIVRLGGPDDPRVEPDFIETILVPLIPITDRLKQKYKDMGVSAIYVDELGNYCPGHNDIGDSDNKGLAKANQIIDYGTNLPNDYLGPKVYDQVVEDSILFIREVSEILIKQTIRMEYQDSNGDVMSPVDIAFKLYFYLLMNAAWKLIIEQALDIDDTLTDHFALELARFSAVTPNDLVNVFLLSNRYILADDQERLATVFKRVDIAYSKNIYDLVKPMFREHTYTYTSNNSGYYLGNKRIGDHKFTIRIIPELVLPLPIHSGTLDTTAEPKITGIKMLENITIVDGTFDERTKQLKDLTVNFANLLNLHTLFISTVANFNTLTNESRFKIDTPLYFSTRATAYGAFNLTMPATNLGNKGVQVRRLLEKGKTVDDLYPDGDLNVTNEFGQKVIAHLSDHCSQYSIGLFKTATVFLRTKFTSYRNMKLFIDHTLGIANHKFLGYTESLTPRVSTRNQLTKGLSVKDPFALTQLVSDGKYTYIHRDTAAFPMYIAQDGSGNYDVRLVNMNNQKSVTKDSVEKVLHKKGKDFYPSPKDANLRIGIDTRSGLLGYQNSSTAAQISVLDSNANILQLERLRAVFIHSTYGMLAGSLVKSVNPNDGAAQAGAMNVELYGQALSAILTHFEDEDLFRNEYVLAEVVGELFKNSKSKVFYYPVPATTSNSGFALFAQADKDVNKAETKELMDIFGMNMLFQIDSLTPEIYEVGKSGLIGKVDTDVILITDKDIYPKTVKITEL